MTIREPHERPRRERALEAALKVLGEQGLRALSHARVDREAGLPLGSTSNYFRTRRALLAGTIAHLAESERDDFGGLPPVPTRAAAEDAFVTMLELQGGRFRGRTLARYALFVDLADSAELAGPLRENRRGFESWTAETLAGLGAEDPVGATAFLMAALDGALLHRITIDPELDVRPLVRRALEACLPGGELG